MVTVAKLVLRETLNTVGCSTIVYIQAYQTGQGHMIWLQVIELGQFEGPQQHWNSVNFIETYEPFYTFIRM